MINTLKLSFYVFCVFLLAGCATGQHRMVSGSYDSSQISIIKGGPFETLHAIDGKPGPNFGGAGNQRMYNSASGRLFYIELDPGTHDLKLFYLEVYRTNALLTKEPAIVTIKTEPGGIYVVDSKFSGQKIDLTRIPRTYTAWDVGGNWTPVIRKIN